MLTPRGWWLLISVLTLLGVALLTLHVTLTLAALVLLVWFLLEWLLFAYRARVVVPALRVRREVRDEHGPVETLWAGRSFAVRVEVSLAGWQRLPYVRVRELVPFGAQRTAGTTERDGELNADRPAVLEYRLRCPAPGRARFEGVVVQAADLQGFFYFTAFVQTAAVYRVLPPLADAEGHTPTVKRHNLLPSPGQHRHPRPGTGSELLDLRDYLPGDPPKTIAWKVSARRDRLITKEFETEVPVRCTLFVDTSPSVRVGPAGQNALARLAEIGAAAAQASAGARDLTGLCLFDDERVTTSIRPARGPRHLVRLINQLGDAAGLAPVSGLVPLDELMRLAYSFAQEVYPSLLRPERNRVPWWLPLLWPLAGRAARGGLRGRLYRGLFVGGGAALFLALVWLAWEARDLFAAVLTLFLPPWLAWLTGGGLLLSLGLFLYRFLENAYRAIPLGFSGRRRRLAVRRKRLAALLALKHGLGPGGLALLLEDDDRFARHLQRFLADHTVPYALPLYDAQGRYLFRSPGKVAVLANALLHAIGKEHDNELFVLLVDLIELPEQLAPLLRAVKVALARHHQLVLICPWPPGVPFRDVARGAGRVPREKPRATDPAALLRQVTTDRLHQAFARLRHTFARLGVPVVCAQSRDPVRLILDRIDRLRNPGRRR